MTENEIRRESNIIQQEQNEAQREQEAARQQETARSNKAKEAETQRAAKEQEKIQKRGQIISAISNVLGGFTRGVGSTLLGKALGGAPANITTKRVNEVESLRRTKANDATNSAFSGNHPVWYSQVPGLVEAVGKVLLSLPLGAEFPWKDYFGEPGNESHAIPGIMSLELADVLGTESDDAINTVAKQLYAWIRKANSGSRNYEATDLMLYIMAGLSIISLIPQIKKTLFLADKFDGMNYYIGDALLKACGLTDAGIEDLRKNFLSYTYEFNVLLSKANTIALPADFPVFIRKIWLYGSIFVDQLTKPAQMYVNKPTYYYVYSQETDINENRAGKLVPKLTHLDTGTTMRDLLDYLKEMVDACIYSSDAAIMSGDIRKAFGEEQLITFTQYNENDSGSYFVYDESFLSQLSNATVTGYPEINSLYIWQDLNRSGNPIQQSFVNPPAYLDRCVYVKLPGGASAYEIADSGPSDEQHVVLSEVPNPTPDDIMVKTRFMATRFPYVESIPAEDAASSTITKVVHLVNHGTELVCRINTYSYRNKNLEIIGFYDGWEDYTQPVSEAFPLSRIFHLTGFSVAPPVRSAVRTQIGTTQRYVARVNYVNLRAKHFGFLDVAGLERIHATAVLSLYGMGITVPNAKQGTWKNK